MRLLFANHTSDWSGAEVALVRLVGTLAPRHTCAVACPTAGPLPRKLDEVGIDRIPLPAFDLTLRMHPVRTPIGLAGLARAGAALRRAASTFDADLIHANSTRAGLMGAVAERLGTVPIVVQVHDDVPLSRAGRATRAAIARSAAGVVAVSDYTAAAFNEGLDPPRAERVYISIDRRCFDARAPGGGGVRRELGLPTGAKVVVEVAQITPWKGQDTAIRMLAGIRRRMPDTHLLLVGSVAFRTKLTRYDNTAFLAGLHELVDDLGLSGHVHFLGHRDDVPAILADADLTVLPSWDEPFGTAAVESMATGTPALVGRIGGVAELVEDGVSGHRLPPRDPDAWARVALELLEHPERLAAMGEAAQARARRFTDEAYAAAMEEAYLRARARCGDGARGGGGGGGG